MGGLGLQFSYQGLKSIHRPRRQRRRFREDSRCFREVFGRRWHGKLFWNDSFRRCDRFRPKIVEIGAILAIFEPFEVFKIHMPLFGEFGRSSRDYIETLYESYFPRDVCLNSSKSGGYVFQESRVADMMIWWYDDMMIWWYDDMMIRL